MRDYEWYQPIEPPVGEAVELEAPANAVRSAPERNADYRNPSAVSRQAIDEAVRHDRAVMRASSMSSRRRALRCAFWAAVTFLASIFGPDNSRGELFAVGAIGAMACLWYTERAVAYARMARAPS